MKKSKLCMILVTFILITISTIYFGESPFRVLPLYVSLIVALLQSQVNRYAYLLGACNSILYAIIYVGFGLYASAAYAFLFSAPMMIITYIRWSRNAYKQSTVFRKMSSKQYLAVGALLIVAFVILWGILTAANSSYRLLDNMQSLIGIAATLLAMMSFVEYTSFTVASNVIGILLYCSMLKEYPERCTYLIYSIYALICTLMAFVNAHRTYREQSEKSIEN